MYTGGFLAGLLVMSMVMAVALKLQLKGMARKSKDEYRTYIDGKFYYVVEEPKYNRLKEGNLWRDTCNHEWHLVQSIIEFHTESVGGYIETESETVCQLVCVKCELERNVDVDRWNFIDNKQKLLKKEKVK